MAKQDHTEGRSYFDDYELKWSDKGITIRVTDYHAGPLTLSWELVFDLAQRVGLTTPVPVITPGTSESLNRTPSTGMSRRWSDLLGSFLGK